MLVLAIGMYRACSTWQYGVASLLIERHRDGRRLGFIEGIVFDQKVESVPDGRSWAILKAHDYHDRFGELLDRGDALALYAYRDLRDVLFSYAHKTGKSFDELNEQGFFELCLKNDRAWRDRPGVLVQRYEDLKRDPLEGVLQIASHLRIDVELAEAESIVDAMSLESNQKRTADLSKRYREEGVDLTSTDQTRFDPNSLFHWNHIRTGKVPTWKEQSSLGERRVMDARWGSWLEDHGYEADEIPAAGPEEIEVDRPRQSYGDDGEDILLDRLFRGIKGTFLDFDADNPVAGNPSYLHHLRGWRGLNVGTSQASRDQYNADRPADLNIGYWVNLPPDTDASRPDHIDAVRGLSESLSVSRFPQPEYISVGNSEHPRVVLDACFAAGFQPKVVILRDTPDAPYWRARREQILINRGYVLASNPTRHRIFLRDDHVSLLPLLAEPFHRVEDRRFYGESRFDLVADRVLAETRAGQAGLRREAEEARMSLIREQKDHEITRTFLEAEKVARTLVEGERVEAVEQRDRAIARNRKVRKKLKQRVRKTYFLDARDVDSLTSPELVDLIADRAVGLYASIDEIRAEAYDRVEAAETRARQVESSVGALAETKRAAESYLGIYRRIDRFGLAIKAHGRAKRIKTWLSSGGHGPTAPRGIFARKRRPV